MLYFNIAGFSQQSSKDTINVRAGQTIHWGDTAFHAKFDTILVLPDTISYKIIPAQHTKGVDVYDTLRQISQRRWFTKKLYELLLVNSDSSKKRKSVVKYKSRDDFIFYKNRIIRDIKIKQLGVFGIGIADSLSFIIPGFDKFVNKVHIDTRKFIIKQNILIDKGDSINAYKLSESERLLRSLPYIRDARIHVVNTDSPDSADVHILVQDMWSVDVGGNIKSIDKYQLSIDDQNFLGMGRKLSNSILFDVNKSPSWAYHGSYYAPNIMGTFISGRLKYENDFSHELAQLKFNRPFFSQFTNYAGGLEISKYVPPKEIILPDSVYIMPRQYFYQDIWFSRAFSLIKKKTKNPIRWASGIRYHRKYYFKRPVSKRDTNKLFHHYHMILGNFSLSKQEFYKTTLIYTFGRTEDVPVGYLYNFTLGWQRGEFYNRPYLGIKFQHGKFYSLGYSAININFDGFFNKQKIEQGQIAFRLNYFSPLFSSRNFRHRYFFRGNYTKGLNRFRFETINLYGKNGIKGLQHSTLEGIHRLHFNFEGVLFLPWYLYGFRTAAFSFLDTGFISMRNTLLNKNNFYNAIGLGLRIRNESLVIKTLTVKFSFYLSKPVDTRPVNVNFSTNPSLPLHGFNLKSPTVIEFE